MSATHEDLPGAPAPSPLRYIPALDGLRGLSLPGTIFTHFTIFLIALPTAPHWLVHAGPFVMNIEMFFVLSGALITCMLVSEHRRTGRISLKMFYLRRSRRLGPALIAVVPLLLIAHFALERTGRLDPLGKQPWITALALLLFVGNWRLTDTEGGLGWMGPAWTLGIEEQFYLTWPALLILMLRRLGKWRIVLTVAVMAGLSVAFSAHFNHRFSLSRAGYMTTTHLSPLLLGCALGYWLASFPEGWLVRLLRFQLVGLAGLAGMAWVSKEWWDDRAFLVSGGYAIYGGFACLLIGHLFVAASRPGVLSRVLSVKPLVIIGQVSYEAYLVHVIVILGVVRAYPTMDVSTMIVIDTALITVISGSFYFFIGRPIRRKGWGVVVGRPTANRPTPAPAELVAPSAAESATGTVFGVLVVAVVASAGSVLGGNSWTGAGVALAIGAVLAHIVARPALR
jgi:peptidoglycan/LPS O-acetylase OafA/YrhL